MSAPTGSANQQLFERAQRVLPGGVNSPVRAFGSVGGTPYFVERGLGSRVWDADGKVYVGNEDGDVFVFRHDTKPDSIDPVGIAAIQVNEKTAKVAYKTAMKLVREKFLLNMIEMEQPIHSTPAVAGGMLYIATERGLFAIAAEK